MGYSKMMRSVFAIKTGQVPPRYSQVKSADDLEHDIPKAAIGNLGRWKPLLLVLLYALLTSSITCLVVWTFLPSCGSNGQLVGRPLLRTSVPECMTMEAVQAYHKRFANKRDTKSSKGSPLISTKRHFHRGSYTGKRPGVERTSPREFSFSFILRIKGMTAADLMVKKPGRGFVFVDNGAQYGLEPGISTEYGDIYSVTMYHQLHCLGLVRRNYWRLVHGIINGTADVIELARKELHQSHTGNCFDYFRQSFQCSADMFLEWPLTSASGQRKQVDGEGVPHVCASEKSIKDYMDANNFNGSHNHDIAA